MVSEIETSHGNPQPQKRNSTPWIIGIVVIVLVCCCCTLLASSWIFGDLLIEILDEIMGGVYY